MALAQRSGYPRAVRASLTGYLGTRISSSPIGMLAHQGPRGLPGLLARTLPQVTRLSGRKV